MAQANAVVLAGLPTLVVSLSNHDTACKRGPPRRHQSGNLPLVPIKTIIFKSRFIGTSQITKNQIPTRRDRGIAFPSSDLWSVVLIPFAFTL
jgi:hypothetical protein